MPLFVIVENDKTILFFFLSLALYKVIHVFEKADSWCIVLKIPKIILIYSKQLLTFCGTISLSRFIFKPCLYSEVRRMFIF